MMNPLGFDPSVAAPQPAAGELPAASYNAHSVVRQALRMQRAFRSIETCPFKPVEADAMRSRIGAVQQAELERLLVEWIREQHAHSVPINHEVVQTVSQQIALVLGIEQFEATAEWVAALKLRHNLPFVPLPPATTTTAAAATTTAAVLPQPLPLPAAFAAAAHMPAGLPFFVFPNLPAGSHPFIPH
ncbi:hypothetical protein M3Y99_01784800 [Aphelenchoides fujianensis]|nr:hypothetical protein M3Y99_01784800 [Aphelenchoides fujianensis]